MVRVLSCHHFNSQDVFTTENKPVSVCVSKDLVFVATENCKIQVHSLTTIGCPYVYTLETIDAVKRIIHNDAGGYVATLEESKLKSDCVFIRIYWNSDIQNLGPLRQSNHQDSPEHENGEQDMYEIASKDSPSYIASCDKSGNLAVSYNATVSVYSVRANALTNGASEKQVKHLIDLRFSFPIHEIAMCEDYIACSYHQIVQVIKLEWEGDVDSSEQSEDVNSAIKPIEDTLPQPQSEETKYILQNIKQRQEGVENFNVDVGLGHVDLRSTNRETYTPSPSPSSSDRSSMKDTKDGHKYIVEDEHYVDWVFETDEATDKDTLPSIGLSPSRSKPNNHPRNTLCIASIEQAHQRAKEKEMKSKSEFLGPGVNDAKAGCTVTVYLKDCKLIKEEVTTYLYRKFPPMDTSLHSLQLVPVYTLAKSSKAAKLSNDQNPFHSDRHGNLVSLSCFISSNREGFLYNIVGSDVKLLSMYPYTSNSKKVVISPILLHAITDTGIETYTTRCHVTALHNIEVVDNVTNAIPKMDLDICLIGMQPFIGVQDMCVKGRHLVLMSKVEDMEDSQSEGNWSVYALRNSSPAQIYQDMLEFGCQHKTTGPPAYLHLLQEAHLVARSHCSFTKNRDTSANALLCESCSLLAQCYCKGSAEESQLALPYYNMSSLPVEEIMEQFQQMKLENQKEGYGDGVIHYLNHLIFQDTSSKLNLPNATCDQILSIYSNKEPEVLSDVILHSRLTGYSQELAASVLKIYIDEGSTKRSSLDLLCLANLHLALGDMDEASMCIFAMSKTELVNICLAEHSMLHDSLATFTPLAQLIRQRHPKQFISILIGLYDNNVLTMETTVKLLQVSCDGLVSENQHVILFLEALLNDDKRNAIFPQVSRQLCEIYLERLAHWRPLPRELQPVSHTHIPRGRGHFAKRFGWLDDLPPFQGANMRQRPCLYLNKPTDINRAPSSDQGDGYGTCPCCCCNEDLLKLQSLLCSSHTDNNLYQLVLEKTHSHNGPNRVGTKDSKGPLRQTTKGLSEPHKDQNQSYSEPIAGCAQGPSGPIRGQRSLEVLCLCMECATLPLDILLDHFPSVLPIYTASQFYTNANQWSYLLTVMLSRIELETCAESKDMYENTLKETLSRMVELLPPKVFLNVLPKDDDVTICLPYINRCFERFQAEKLKTEIINRGHQLEATLF
ncbi:unnamed protein product [Owenia fusiformis]|uniref:Uncharacterized protein n=1 Tax=Owenia fusiformis TaxID=6347 RepID=A0A8J1Y0Z0_OWEFU|nr:unnamed protein product [Owenia fusiformis]